MNKLFVGLLGLAIVVAAGVIGYVVLGAGDKAPAQQQAQNQPKQLPATPQPPAPQPVQQPAAPQPPATPQPASAKPLPAGLAPMDTNGDNAVDLAEFLSFRMKVFEALDTNKDGNLVRDEFLKLAEPPYVPADATNLPPLAERQKFLAADFDRIDTNKDGKISKQEAQIQFTDDFKRADANKDGMLTADDLDQGAKRVAKIDFIDAELKRYDDASKDGKMTYDQFAAAAKKENPDLRIPPEQLEAALRVQFAEMDENKDKIVSREEYLTYIEARFKVLDCNGDGALDEKDAACTNRICKDAFIGSEMGQFDRADANKDGKVTLAEYIAAARVGIEVPKDKEEQFRRTVETQFKAIDLKKAGIIARADYQIFIAKRFEELDANKDGCLDATEVPQQPPPPPAQTDRISRADFEALELRRYLAADANNDGFVGLDEIVTAALKTPRPQGVTETQVRDAVTRQFKVVDTNNDGKLSKQEISAYANKRFKDMDANGDGIVTKEEAEAYERKQNQPQGPSSITRQEFINMQMPVFVQADKNRDGKLTLEEMLATVPDKLTPEQKEQAKGNITIQFNQLDTNRDGVVTREEFAAAIGARFDQMDANKDGKLTQEEANAFNNAGPRPPAQPAGPRQPAAGQPRQGGAAPPPPVGGQQQPLILMPPPTPIR